jgi:Flp pilus assembly protein TadD
MRRTLSELRQEAAEAPNAAPAHALGQALVELGQVSEALTHLQRAAALDPAQADYAYTLAAALARAGETPRAREVLQQLRALDPASTRPLLDLAGLASGDGRLDEVFTFLKDAIEREPARVALYVQLARTCAAGRTSGEIIAHLRHALGPAGDPLLIGQGVARAIMYEGRYEEARDCYLAMLREAPDDPQCLTALGCIGFVMRDMETALAYHERASRVHPEDQDVFYFHTFDLCALGRLAEARQRVEAWKSRGGRLNIRPVDYGQPDCGVSGSLEGKTVLCHGGWGYGDTIIMARFVSCLKARGATVIVECQPALTSLMRTVPGVDAAVSRYEPCPPFDFECILDEGWLLSDCDVEQLGSWVPYVTPSPASVAAWAARIPRGSEFRSEFSREVGRERSDEFNGEFNVGLAWRTEPRFTGDKYFDRSLSIDLVRPLLSVPGARVHLMQADIRSEERAAAAPRAIDCGSTFGDFADSAAAVQRMDLVITVDTSMAHLAGALGVPTFVLMPYTSWGWRWFPGRDDSPWYPQTRLFWQDTPGDWTRVLARAAAALTDRIEQHRIEHHRIEQARAARPAVQAATAASARE